MQFLADLWMPIVVAAVVVFVVSSVIHMMLPLHKGDYGKLPGEDAILAAMRDAGVKPGRYNLAGCTSMKDLATPGMKEKYEAGPVGHLIVRPNGVPAIGPSLIQWFLLSLVIGLFAAYAGHHALPAGADTLAVVRITGTVAVAGYALGSFQDSIWKGVPWAITAKFLADGIVYGFLTGAIFAWLWPATA